MDCQKQDKPEEKFLQNHRSNSTLHDAHNYIRNCHFFYLVKRIFDIFCMAQGVFYHSMIKRDYIIDQLSIPEKFFFWIHDHITEPIKGFDHKLNMDGTPYTRAQQLHETRKQAVAIVHDFMKRGKSELEIFEILYYFKD